MSHLILITDTAHPTARVIVADEKQILGSREFTNTPKVGTDLLIYIDELLQELKLDKTSLTRIGVHAGPGSYGLVRTGIVTATILAQAVGAELVEVEGETAEELVESGRNGEVVKAVEARYRGY
ncbi:MAG TPA: hypothetical protein VJI96_04235 [Candidatus Andersenbacteria bacterium]|nr:hypothetical protein [Candidatus Andersenbacteria bacterium]